MEIVPSNKESSRAVMLGFMSCNVEMTPCKVDAGAEGTLCQTPNVQVMTPLSRIVTPTDYSQAEEGIPPSQPEASIVGKPPLIRSLLPLIDMKISDTENVPRKLEVGSKILPVKAVAVLKEMPFKERNREEGKRMIPPHIKVPPKKLFGYPERYKSPTDAMVSPISKGLLARNRRPARTLAPVVPPKALENTFQEAVVDGELANREPFLVLI